MSDGDAFVLQSFINQWPSQSVCQFVSSASRTSRVLGSRTELHYLDWSGYSQCSLVAFILLKLPSLLLLLPRNECLFMALFTICLQKHDKAGLGCLSMSTGRQGIEPFATKLLTSTGGGGGGPYLSTHEHRNREAHSLQQQ